MIATFLFLTLWVSTYSMEIHLDIDVGEFKVEQEADGTLRIQADGWVHGFIPNALDIPSKPIFVVLPQHTKLVDVEIVDAETLEPVKKIESPVMVAVAAFLGKARLIDNIVVNPQ